MLSLTLPIIKLFGMPNGDDDMCAIMMLSAWMNKQTDASGKLTAAALCQTVAAVQPPDCIVVDESLTSGGAYWEYSKATNRARCHGRELLPYPSLAP